MNSPCESNLLASSAPSSAFFRRSKEFAVERIWDAEMPRRSAVARTVMERVGWLIAALVVGYVIGSAIVHDRDRDARAGIPFLDSGVTEARR